MMIIKGWKAIALKERAGDVVELNKYNDPTEEERFDVSIEYAKDVARQDPGLIWCDVVPEWNDSEDRKIGERAAELREGE